MTSPTSLSQDLYLGPALFSLPSWGSQKHKRQGPPARLPSLANTHRSHTATLPAAAVAFGSVVHEDAPSGRPCPEAGHVDHRAGDKVVPVGRRTEEGSSDTQLYRQLCREKALPGKGPRPPSPAAQAYREHTPCWNSPAGSRGQPGARHMGRSGLGLFMVTRWCPRKCISGSGDL